MNAHIDTYDLKTVILEQPNQFMQGFEAAKNTSIEGDFRAIMVSGIGGSALHINILMPILRDIWRRYEGKTKRFEVFQNRYYSLPREAFDRCLHIVCSYSGNTEETTSSFEQIIKNDLPCIGISSGGKIEEMCKEHNIPHFKLPVPFENFQPRMASAYFMSSILQFLINSKMLPDIKSEILENIDEMHDYLRVLEGEGREIAGSLVNKIPIIYSSTKFKSLAMVWKIKINENSKVPAFWNYFSEWNHNEMLGYTQPLADFSILMLRDPHDDPRMLVRYEAMKKIFNRRGIDAKIIDIEGDTIYGRVFRTLYLGDWISYYLALEYGVDPTPIDLVEDFKKMLISD